MPDLNQTGELRALSIDRSPVEMAAGLLHLPDLVFLDSSSADGGNLESGSRFSIIAARPVSVQEGNINCSEDRQTLRDILQRNRTDGIDRGFPVGGLIGGIDYDGAFHFGEYPEMLVFDHLDKRWHEVGTLSNAFRPSVRPFVPNLTFQGSSDREAFCKQVERAIEYIESGDIYQVNLTHRFAAEWNGTLWDAFELYERLREISPAPFSGFFQLGERTVLSASPEQFLRISGRLIETRPIKGTRPRFRDREKDEKSAYDLITSPKEISELIMITDLERNDLGQVCEFGSVEATELLKLERFAQVFHLVSTVQGNLREDIDHIEALRACFPGGSITGAPKKRASEIIEVLEPIPRDLYTGTLGCFGFNGESIFNIVIRTAICESETLHFHVGAGIVADSDPEAEWEETLHKAAGIFRATSEK